MIARWKTYDIILGDHEHEVSAWAPIWYMSMGINFFGGIAYALGASGDEQPWNEQKMNTSIQCKFEIDQFFFRQKNMSSGKEIEGMIQYKHA